MFIKLSWFISDILLKLNFKGHLFLRRKLATFLCGKPPLEKITLDLKKNIKININKY